jgi:hypothetical protein
VSDDWQSADSLMRQNDALRRQLADVMRAGDLEHARMAALIEACTAVADFIETYTPDSAVAHVLPSFYSVFRVYGKNARAAVAAVRPQADALIARMADLETTKEALIARNITYLNALHSAYDALMSYAYGNSAPDLAKEVAAHMLAIVEEASA